MTSALGDAAKKQEKVTISARPIGFLADFTRASALRRILAVAVLAAIVGAPATAAQRARRVPVLGQGYDGYWNVLIITQAGRCDQTYSFPVTISRGRISSSGGANVSGSVTRGGHVAVMVSSGGSVASGSGRLGAGYGTGRWIGRGSAGVCSGRWQATRS